MTSFRRLTLVAPLLAAVALSGGGGAWAQDDTATEAVPEGTIGALLAGRVAIAENDFERMAEYFDRAAAGNPDDPLFLELAMQGNLLSGSFDRAVELARRVGELGGNSQAAALILQAEAFANEDFDQALDGAENIRLAGPLPDAMAIGWAHLGAGSMTSALAAFDDAIDTGDQLVPFALYQKALALALVGDLETAAEILRGEAFGPVSLTRRGVVAHMTILSQIGRHDEALSLADDMFGASPEDDVVDLIAQLEAGAAIPFTTVRNATDGMAEVYFILASALQRDQSDWLPLIYARLVQFLRPDHPDGVLLLGQLLEQVNQYQLADQAYASLSQDSPFYLGAQLGRANALYQADASDDAIALLEALVDSNPTSVLAQSALGDLHRREENFAPAAEAYTRAIDALDEVEERHWVLLYSRAISYERLGEWELAEAEFRRVLEFVPDEPQVLNYLGYSLVEQGRNLDEALDMIERAVAGEPDSGYITDSLGWVFFRLGRYDEAVPVMERAVELLPTDPILNDHLGDVYWAVGRAREARFQWSRAISFGPHPDLDMDRVRRKLDVGLDVVLDEDGAPPLRAADP